MSKSSNKPPRKYGPGEPYRDLDELLDQVEQAIERIASGGSAVSEDFAWDGYRVAHLAWLGHTSGWQLRWRVRRGMIRRAVVTQEYREWLERELGAIQS